MLRYLQAMPINLSSVRIEKLTIAATFLPSLPRPYDVPINEVVHQSASPQARKGDTAMAPLCVPSLVHQASSYKM